MTSRPPSRHTDDSTALLSSTAQAAFASDASGRITVWNAGAEALLGHEAPGVIGKRCFEVIRGRDIFGNRLCNESCAVRKMRRHREPIHPFRFLVSRSLGDMQEVHCSVIVDSRPGGRCYTVIHLLQPVGVAACSDGSGGSDLRPALAPRGSDAPQATSPIPAPRLTAREVQVLQLVASGTAPGEIAKSLDIAKSTVDNHIQHILDKLDASNKLQAVFVARRDGMI